MRFQTDFVNTKCEILAYTAQTRRHKSKQVKGHRPYYIRHTSNAIHTFLLYIHYTFANPNRHLPRHTYIHMFKHTYFEYTYIHTNKDTRIHSYIRTWSDINSFTRTHGIHTPTTYIRIWYQVTLHTYILPFWHTDLNFITLHYTLHYSTLHVILHYITLHVITLHVITLRSVT